jgi:hypothetical protein
MCCYSARIYGVCRLWRKRYGTSFSLVVRTAAPIRHDRMNANSEERGLKISLFRMRIRHITALGKNSHSKLNLIHPSRRMKLKLRVCFSGFIPFQDTECLKKKRFTTLKACIHLFRGHLQCF